MVSGKISLKPSEAPGIFGVESRDHLHSSPFIRDREIEDPTVQGSTDQTTIGILNQFDIENIRL